MSLSYDRRAPKALMSALCRGGFAASLADYVRAGLYPVDLQLRGYAGKNDHWATLYVGLTKVLDLHHRPTDRYKVTAHPTYAHSRHGWNEGWARFQSEARMAASWPEVEEYLDRVIPEVGPRYLKEGRTQVAVTMTREWMTIDREVTFAFKSVASRSATHKELALPLLDAIGAEPQFAGWSGLPTSLGGECDAFAIQDGELLAIEVKPRSGSAAGLTWVPLQVRHYANLAQRWFDEAPDAASQVLAGMVAQRIALDLHGQATDVDLRAPVTVRPVVVIEQGAKPSHLERMKQVERCLRDAGVGAPVETFLLSPAGRLKPYDIYA